MRSHATTPDSSPENTALRFVWEDRAAAITAAGVASLWSGGEARGVRSQHAAEPGPGRSGGAPHAFCCVEAAVIRAPPDMEGGSL